LSLQETALKEERMLKKTILVLFAVVMAGTLLLADPPVYSGKWVLNKEQSQVRTRDGNIPDITLTVEQAADYLKIKQESSSEWMNRDYTLKLNGETQEVAGRGGRTAKITPKWEANSLLLTTVREGQQGTMTSTEQWNLSADGKVLTITSKMQTPRGEFESKMVYDKK
jgi:hypothetical protein